MKSFPQNDKFYFNNAESFKNIFLRKNKGDLSRGGNRERKNIFDQQPLSFSAIKINIKNILRKKTTTFASDFKFRI